MSHQLVRLRGTQVKRNANARKNLGDPEKAKALALSRIEQQIHPLIATTGYVLIDGYRTLWGLELLNRLDAELDFILTDEKLTPARIALMQGLSAIHREDWPLADKCEWVIELAKTMAGKDIAAELGVDPAMVSNWRSFERLIPEAKDDRGKSQAEVLLGCFSTKVLHAIGDSGTAEWASNILGKEVKIHHSTNTSGDERSTGSEIMGQAGMSFGSSEHVEAVLEPKSFMHGLRTGGKNNGYMADAIIIRTGEPFSDGNSWMFRAFTQR